MNLVHLIRKQNQIRGHPRIFVQQKLLHSGKESPIIRNNQRSLSSLVQNIGLEGPQDKQTKSTWSLTGTLSIGLLQTEQFLLSIYYFINTGLT